ncbi:hypothetical protein GTQ48_07135 [Alteromonas genovensis]|jgi:hypothetical protein|uniref:Uncharacterized protein n=1 Tax=Alteromonas genovensis TaxID=471225 RepID=A0A6N9TKT6_9ALTE|nr:hypothetical protein [Alteromonas genovensis]NDW15288.1 hypothetical protein [Alteromonas genovensis]
MAMPRYVMKALDTLLDEHSTISSKSIARQILKNSGLSEDDIKVCVKKRTLSHTYIFEA